MHRQTGILEVISLWLQEGINQRQRCKKGYVRRLLISLTGAGNAGDIRTLPARSLYGLPPGWEIDPVA